MFRYARAKQVLDERGRTRKWLAAQLNLTRGTLDQYLAGKQKPGRETVAKMAELLETPLADLEDDTGTQAVSKEAIGQAG